MAERARATDLTNVSGTPADVEKPAAAALSFADLRERREAAGISLNAIASATKVPLTLLQDLERGDVSRWPGGLYARAHLTAYARHAKIPVDEILGLMLEVARRRQPNGPAAIESPNRPATADLTSAPGTSPIVSGLLVVATLATFVFGAAVVRYVRHAQEAPSAEATASAPDSSQVATDRKRSADPVVASAPPGSVANSPVRPAATPADSRPVATAGAPAPLNPAAIEALRAERARVAAALDENRTLIAQSESERDDVGKLLEAAPSEDEAAAFRQRLEAIADQLTSLARTKQRLSASLRSIDRRLKPPAGQL